MDAIYIYGYGMFFNMSGETIASICTYTLDIQAPAEKVFGPPIDTWSIPETPSEEVFGCPGIVFQIPSE